MSCVSTRFGARSLLIYFFVVCKNIVLHQLGVNGELSQGRRREIVNGIVVDPSDAKFFVRSGRDNDKNTPDYVCGGMLVHSDIILTAAHCQGAFNYGVFLYDRRTNDYTREAKIDLQIRYPDFNGIDTHNDILLLRLSSESGLPPLEINSNNSTPTNDEVMKVYGFGQREANGSASKKLRVGEMRYIDNDECSKRVRGTANPVIWDDVLCADPYYDIGGRIEEGSSICQGDSGGPLLDSSNNVVGVTSWNFYCKSDELPDGFARVSYFHDWIMEQICFISRNPPMSTNKCLSGTSPPPSAPESVKVFLTFNHDFYPEETFFRILSKDRDGQVEYAGPKYVPARESAWTSQIFLLPGAYTLEVFDMAGNGLSPGDIDRKGSWKLVASYEKGGEKELASGGADFRHKDLVDFVVDASNTASPTRSPTRRPTQPPTRIPTKSPTSSPTQNSQIQISETTDLEKNNLEPSDECLTKKFIEEISLSSSPGIVCNCVYDDFSSSWVLGCYDSIANTKCVENRGVCSAESSLLCCGDRRCSNGICRTVLQGTNDRRKPLLVSGYNGSSSRLRGTYGGD